MLSLHALSPRLPHGRIQITLWHTCARMDPGRSGTEQIAGDGIFTALFYVLLLPFCLLTISTVIANDLKVTQSPRFEFPSCCVIWALDSDSWERRGNRSEITSHSQPLLKLIPKQSATEEHGTVGTRAIKCCSGHGRERSGFLTNLLARRINVQFVVKCSIMFWD